MKLSVNLHRLRALLLPVPQGRMGTPRPRAGAAALAGESAPPTPATAGASARAECWMERPRCRAPAAEVPWPFSWDRDGWQTCLQRCAGVEDFLQLVAELQEVMRRL